jgi:hypothetical protein
LTWEPGNWKFLDVYTEGGGNGADFKECKLQSIRLKRIFKKTQKLYSIN